MTTYKFCWFWDNYCSIDVAAWLQAIGSLIALALTIGIYIHQTKKAGREKRRAQALVANHFADTALGILNECLGAYSYPVQYRAKELRKAALRIDDVRIWSRIFVIDTFNNNELVSFMQVRNKLHEIEIWICQHDNEEISINKSFIEQKAQDCNQAIVTLLRAM